MAVIKNINLQKSLIIFGLPFLIIGAMILLAQSSVFDNNADKLSIGITLDVVLIVPILYFLLIRKTSIPKTTVVPFFILGLVVCSLILPSENQSYLDLIKTWVLPAVESFVFIYVFLKLRKAIEIYKHNKVESFDFFSAVKQTCSEILPAKLVVPFSTEIAIFYYGFVYWKKRKLRENEFSYHKESGTITLFIAIIAIVGIEVFVLHGIVVKWNVALAWVLTILSIYSGLQIFGFVKSMLKRPISIEGEQLFLRYGVMSETVIDVGNIQSVEVSSKDIELSDETTKLSFLGNLEGHNIVIRLKSENELTGLYGRKKSYKNLAVHVDDKNKFVDQLSALLT